MKVPKKIMDLLFKLNELAKRGVDGEKETANKMLSELLKKYDLTLADIEPEVIIEKEFKVPSDRVVFFSQIAAHVTGSGKYSYRRRQKSKLRSIYIKATKAQLIEIEAKFNFFLPLYDKEMELFYKAFIYKNNLTANLKDEEEEEDRELTPEELDAVFRIRQMMSGINRHQFHKQLKN